MQIDIEITEDQLAIDWTLTDGDSQFVNDNTRGFKQTIKFAAQLCHLRAHGVFMDQNTNLPISALNYLAKQLGGMISTAPSFAKNTYSYFWEEKICRYLNYRKFDEEEALSLEQWLVVQLKNEPIDKQKLSAMALEHLKKCRIVLPSRITLGRMISQKVNQAIERFHRDIAHSLPAEKRTLLQDLITPEHKGAYSRLTELKKTPANANSAVMNEYLAYFETIQKIGILECDLSAIHPDVIAALAKKGRYYDAAQLRDIPSKLKREAIIICFLYETVKNILDYLMNMYKRILLDINRKSKNEVSAERVRVATKNKGKLKPAGDFIRQAFSQDSVKNLSLVQFIEQFNKEDMLESASACEAIDKLEETGISDHIVNRFSYIRQFSKRFLNLELKAKVGLKSLLNGLEILRKLHAEEIKELPANVPTEFLPQFWKDVLYDGDGKIRPHHWEMGFYYALKKEISAGDIFLTGSRNNRYFWDTVYGEQPWQKEREQQYLKLKLPNEFDSMMDELKGAYHRVATNAKNSLPNNDFVTIKGGKFHFTKDDALIISPEVVQLRKLIQSMMPAVRIEQLLAEVAKFSGFTDGFTPFYAPDAPVKIPRKPLLAAIIAHATNIGLFGMGVSAVGINLDSLTHASHTYLRPDTIKEGNRRLINHLLTYPVNNEMTDGTWSTSDAERYAIEAKCSLSSYYPRYYGYYQQVLSIYTHVSRNGVFGTQVISTGEREATYVLTGLLENDTLLNPEFHSTDTHGYTEHLFALCYLLGIGFHPRLKDLAEQNIYKIDKAISYGDLDDVFSGAVDIELIRENWDQIVRIVASLKNGLAPAHVIIQKLANRTDNVSKAIRAFGRIIKTIYILRYIADQDLRYTVHLHLNQGESRHHLAKKLFFLNRGVFKTSDYEEIMNKASCLSLVSNAVLIWNTHHVQKIVDKLRAEGHVIPSEHLQKISALMFKHIQIHGTYHFEDL